VELPPPEDDGGLAENYGLPLAGYYGSGDMMNSSWVEGGLGGAAPSDAQQQQEDAEAQRSERVSLTGWRGARNSVGIGASGPTVFCDVCCLGRPASSDDDHIASEMMQAGSITRVMARQDKLLTRKPWDDRDRRCARHACYKGVISWQFGGSLGAGNRVRLPWCVVCAIRKKYPNPVCDPHTCDYWVECERAGHYTGFRTADESRAVREGQYLSVDVR
jgi:hypothetical protein